MTQKELRPHLKNVEWLAKLNCQKIALSATIPPRIKDKILSAIGINPWNSIIREASIQPKVKYHLLHAPNNKEALKLLNKVVEYVKANLLQGGKKAIIFFKGTQACQNYAESHGLPYNHSKRPNVDNARDMEEFRSKEGQLMCATPGLAAGLNVESIVATIFLALAFGTIDFYQSCGRGSRDQRRSDAIVVDVGDDKRKLEVTQKDDLQMWKPMVEWSLGKHKCDREFLTDELDGVGLSCQDLPSTDKCCLCKPDALNQHLLSLSGESSPSASIIQPSHTHNSNTTQDTVPTSSPTSLPIDKGKKRQLGNSDQVRTGGSKLARTENSGSNSSYHASATARSISDEKDKTAKVGRRNGFLDQLLISKSWLQMV